MQLDELKVIVNPTIENGWRLLTCYKSVLLSSVEHKQRHFNSFGIHWLQFYGPKKQTLLIFLRSIEERHSYRIRNWVWLNNRIVIFDDLIFTKPSFAPSLLKLFCNICGYYSKTLLENQVLIFLSGRNRIKTDLNVYFLEHIICFVSVCVLQVLIRGIRPTLLILGRQRIKIICNVFTNLHNSCCFCKIKTPKH